VREKAMDAEIGGWPQRVADQYGIENY